MNGRYVQLVVTITVREGHVIIKKYRDFNMRFVNNVSRLGYYTFLI